MSTTMEKIDARAMLTGWLQGLSHMFKKDINAIPEDKWNETFGGCTRPCSDIAADTVGFMFWTTKAIEAGGTPADGDPSAREKLAEACKTRAGAIAMFEKATGGFTTAFNAATDETLMKTAMAPWGMESKLYEFAQISISHIWYHDGQLNYVQCLLGDGEYHWTEH